MSIRPALWNRVSGGGRFAAFCLLLLFLVALALIVFLPAEGHQSLQLVGKLARVAEMFGVPYRPAFTVIEFSLNIVLFVPFGLLFPLVMGSVHPAMLCATVALGAVGSVVIEMLQLDIPGRVTASSDVVANTLGTLCGVLILGLWRLMRRY